MTLIYSEEFTVPVEPREDIISFNCNPNIEADLHNEEGKCCCWISEHTYSMVVKAGEKPVFMEGYLRIGPSEREGTGNCKLHILEGDTWIEHEVYTVSYKENTLFKADLSQCNDIRGFKFTSAYIDLSYGKISYESITASTKEECGECGGYWYNGECHLIEPEPQILDNEEDCEYNGYYWCNECLPMPTTCEGWLTEQDCLDAGCEWWDDECHRPGTKVVEYELPEGEIHTGGNFNVHIPGGIQAHILRVKYELAYTYDCTGYLFIDMPLKVGYAGFVKYDNYTIFCNADEPVIKSYDHDIASKNKKGSYVQMGSKIPDFTCTHFKCKIYYTEG